MMHVVAAMAVMMCIMLLDGNTIISEAADIKLNSNAKVRSEASTSSNVVGNAANGATLSLLGEVTGGDGYVWYQVSVNGATGYIRSDLAEKVSGDMTQAEVERENSYTETSATVSETSVSSGKISVDSANVRKGPSSTDAPVTNVKSGTEIAISGEAIGADGNVWYQVSVNGKTGFIRSDLVEAAEAEEPEESEEPEEEEEEESSEEEEIIEDAGTIQISNVISSRILPGDVDLADMTIDETLLEEWKSANFYVLYTKDSDNNEKWYLYSLEDNQIAEIDSLQGDGESTESSLIEGNNKIILLIVAALFIVLILVCILLALKLHEYREYYEDDDEDDEEDDEEDDDDEDDEDEDDDDDEEDDEEDDEDEDERPIRKARWSPKNFLSRREDEDDEEEDEEEDDEDDEDDEDEEYLDDDDFEFEFLNMDGKDKFR